MTPTPDASSPPSTRPGTNPVVPAVASAVLFWFAFPPADYGFLAWFALAPFFALIRSERRPRLLYGAAWLGGLAFWGLAIFWVAQASVLGWSCMVFVLSLGWPMFLGIARIAVGRLKLPAIVAAPIVWLAIEYGRMFVLSGLPWYYLAHSQYRYLPIIQASDLAGAWGLSLLMAAANVLWVDLVTLPLMRPTDRGPKLLPGQLLRLVVVGGAFAGVLVYGGIRLSTAKFRPGPRLALLQTDFAQEVNNPPSLQDVMDSVARLTRRALEDPERPDLVVWPESSYPQGVVNIAPGLEGTEFARQVRGLARDMEPGEWRVRQKIADAEIHRLTELANVPFLVGTVTYEFGLKKLDRYNTALLVQPGRRETASYHKQSLVAFGEYIPFLKAMPWLLVIMPFEDGNVPGLSSGAAPAIFEVDGTRFAPIICFEDTVPDLVRRAFTIPGQRPPDVLVNLTNDGWFRGSAEHRTHLAASVFRAVECRAPLARSVNTGMSAIIDGDGRIVDSLEPAHSGVLGGRVPLDDRSSLYLRVGDALPMTCAAVTIGLVPLGFWRRRPRADR